MSLFTTRPATMADLGELFELHREVFAPHIEKLWGWDEVWQRERFLEHFQGSETTIVEVDGHTVGYVQLEVTEQRFYLHNLALRAEVQGGGIGTRIVDALQRRAHTAQLPLELSVFRTNPRVERLYRRLGFIRYREDVAYFRLRWIGR